MPNILIKDSYKLFLEKMSGDDVKSVILALINQDDSGLEGNAAVAYGVILSDKVENDKRKAQKRGSYGSYTTHRGTGSYWTRNEYTPQREDD